MEPEESEGFTSFPLSYSLPESSESPSEDGTFSILPRYLLQKVKNTFGAGASDGKRDSSRPSPGSRQNSSSSNYSSSSKFGSTASRPQADGAVVNPSVVVPVRAASRSHAVNAKPPRIASIRDEASSTVSRSRRLSTVNNARQTLPPLLSRPHAESVQRSPFFGTNSLSRSHSQSLSTLPEGSGDYSPPPAYSASPNSPFNAIPGFPISREVLDDGKSASSVAGSNTGVTQIFRRLRGEALSRDYWMADEAAVDCYDCNTAFTTWRRKHHCRVCGRIFCSRCASNIIPGARFGHEGLIRVCNICVALLSHRSKSRGQVHGEGTDRIGLPASSSVANLNISLPLQSSYRAGQSQYMNSTLFPRNDYSSYNLAGSTSIDDFGTLQHRARRFSDASVLRPATPDMLDESVSPRPAMVTLGSPLYYSPQKGLMSGQSSSTASPLILATTPAPFRKTTADEDRTLQSSEEAVLDEEDPYTPPLNTLHVNGLGITEPATPVPLGSPLQGISAPETNDGSHDGSGGGHLASSTGIPTTPSAASFLAQPLGLSYVRSRLNSRAAEQVFDLADVDDNLLVNPTYFDNLLRTQEQFSSLSTDITFHKLAIGHMRKLLRQCLEQASVPNKDAWEDVLLKLLIKVAKGPRPRVRDGDSMDVRKYIKIKRVPGGLPIDSEYISGTVFTKSILNKNLPRLLPNPRIMLFDYAFEYEQGETRLSRLDSLRESEKDSLRKLTNSVIDHRPHIVLVGKSVSGLALEYLHKAGIIVARNVKASALQAAARCTQAGIFDTYQFFPDNTRLGRCAVFRAQTLVHKLIPGGRKTLMRFEGCNKDLNATILLRGGDIATLSKIKRVMRFMTLAAYSVRLELQLLWDEQASLVDEIQLNRVREFTEDDLEEDFEQNDEGEEDVGKQREKQKETARIVNQALTPYVQRVLSTSPTIVFPPPHSLQRLRQDNATIRKLQSHHQQERTITAATIPIERPVEAPTSTNSGGGEPEDALQASAALTRSLSDVSLFSVKPQTRTRALQISAQLAEESQIQEAETRRNDHLTLWENRLARYQDDVNATSHQNLAVLQTVICQTTTRMCDGPRLVQRYYYREGSDQTLRGFVESSILSASQKCPEKGCDRVMLSHYTTYAHGQKRMHVVVEPHLLPAGSEDDIFVWSVCRGCELKTLPTTLSEEAANFSFGKYLELSFYSDYLGSRALPCEHNLHSDQIRFLCWRNVALRIIVDPIDVYDVVVPPLRLRVDAWTQLRIKNDEYRAIQKSTSAYWNSVLARIHNFNQDLLPLDRVESGRQMLASFEDRANADQAYFEIMLDKAYEDAPISQPAALNSVRVALQAKVVHWETEFINFEQTYIPSEGEKARRATSSHLRRLFSDPNSSMPTSPESRTSFSSLPSVPASPVISSTPHDRTPTTASTPEHENTSIMAMLGRGTSQSPTMFGEGLPAAHTVLPDMPTLRLTGDDMAVQILPQHAPEPVSIFPLGRMTSMRDLLGLRPTADEDSHTDSDSTVCADPPRGITFMPLEDENRSESEELVAQRPVKFRRPRPVPSIANLVNRFEESAETNISNGGKAMYTPIGQGSTSASKPPTRPGMRRGKSDYSEVRTQRTRQASGDRETVLSDGDLPKQVTLARAPSLLRSPNKPSRPKSPAQMRKRPSLNSVPSTSSSSRASSSLTVPGSRTLRGALGAPLRLPEREHGNGQKPGPPESAGAKTTGARAVSLHGTTIDPKGMAGRPSTLLLSKSGKRLPTLGPAPIGGNRVSTMTKHFNYLSRQAERERQKQVVLSRQRRARPLAIPRASANVFVSSKEALKEDSDDEGSSSGADDEMDGDEDEEKDKQEITKGIKSGPGPIDLVKVDQFLRDHKANLSPGEPPMPPSMQTSLNTSEDSAETDPASIGTGTESGPSIPPSPMIGSEPVSLPRYGHLSESEMSSSTGTERQMSLIKTLSSLWSYRGAEFTPLELPQSKLEHFDSGSRIIVREDEPSSIISHGLDSQLYKDLMKEGHNYSVASSSEVFMPESEIGHGGNRSSNWDVLEFQTDAGTDLEEVMKKPTDRHLRLAWDDATLRYTIRVFFADQFDALRKNSGCQELFIESLARCHKWDAQGGKSGSAFLKTKDDRFIIKEISPAEMTALLDFAPKYFQYLSRAYFDDLPTVLAKILGVFRISFKSQSSGRNKRMDVLVMENIYYNKTITEQFDLKGSLRNRMVETSSGKNTVLLDENLIQISYDKPFYVREHTKKHLETALHNDSLFLSNQKIMDYSLIVGVDKTSTELVVGIVGKPEILDNHRIQPDTTPDFLRPYTWDKRLETWVKETAYIGGGPREPTVLNPRIYKNRFREAMSRYFLLVPDRWTSAEAIATGQPLPMLNTAAPATKSKSSQAASVLEDQEQFTGGASRTHSPTTKKRFVPMAG